MLYHVSVHSFSRLNNISFYGYATFSLIYSFVDRNLGCFHFLASLNNTAMNIVLFFPGETSPLIRSNAVWNATLEMAFCKSMDGNYDRSNVCSEGKSVSRLSAYSSKNKMLPLP